jgi:hypothetical protein
MLLCSYLALPQFCDKLVQLAGNSLERNKDNLVEATKAHRRIAILSNFHGPLEIINQAAPECRG